MTPDLDTRLKAKREAKRGATPAAEQPSGSDKPGRRGRSESKQDDRFAPLNDLVDHVLRHVDGIAEVKTWMVLFREVKNGVAKAGMTDIATRAGLTRRGVVKAIARLKARGLILVVSKGTVGGATNTYRLLVPPREPVFPTPREPGFPTLGNHGCLP
jgi:hypothetical protein